MKKMVLASAIVMALAITAPALAKDSGFYAGVQVGKAKKDVDYNRTYSMFSHTTSGDDSGISQGLFVGYNVNRYVGIELAYTDLSEANIKNDINVKVEVIRFLSLDFDEVGAISYSITPINRNANIVFRPYLDAGIKNNDSNWDDQFWNVTKSQSSRNKAFIESHTMKTNFHVCTFME